MPQMKQAQNDHVALDQFDLALLRQMQIDCRQSSSALSQTIPLSATAIQRRIKRLRECGVILAEQALVAPNKLGNYLQLLVVLRLKKGGREINSRVMARLQPIAEIQQCYAVAGEFDYALIMLVRNMAEYELLSKELFQQDGDVERYETTVVMETIKQTFAVPL